MKISGTFKDASGKMWLSLGNLYSETMTLTANIRLDNMGDLPSFAKITVIPKGLAKLEVLFSMHYPFLYELYKDKRIYIF